MGVKSFVTVFAVSVLVPSLIWAATPPAAKDAACAISCTVGVISEISDTTAASTTFFGPTLWPYSYVSQAARKDYQISNQTGDTDKSDPGTTSADTGTASIDHVNFVGKNTINSYDLIFTFYVNGQVEILVSSLDIFDLLVETAESTAPDVIEQMLVNKTFDGTIVWSGNHPIKPVVKNSSLNMEQIPGKKTIKITFTPNALAKTQNLYALNNQSPQTITVCWKS